MSMRARGFFVLLVLLILGGCAFDDLKFFSGMQQECLPPTSIGQSILWGYKFARNTTVPPGNFKFKFNLDPVNGGVLPAEYGFVFTHKAPGGRVLFSDSFSINAGSDAAIPFQTIQLNGITFKKNESLNLSLTPLGRSLPLSDLKFNWNYRATPQLRIAGSYPARYPERWYTLLSGKEIRRTSSLPKNISFSAERVRVIP